MKRALLALLRACGLVPARRYEALVRETKTIKADRLDWKRKAVEASTQARSFKKQAARQAKRLAEVVKASDSGPRRRQLDGLRSRLEGAERELATAREHLMVVESKLDILEGAANVLDARTRHGVAQGPGETGAAV